jgi:hypothetical protein
MGIWVKAGKPLAVIMDYVNTYEGETLPFIAVFDENRSLVLNNSSAVNKVHRASLSMDFGDAGPVAAQTYYEKNITVAGASFGDCVFLGVPASAMPADAASYSAYVIGVDTVAVRFVNASPNPLTPNSGIFKVTIIK